jgi:hypothetical protein
VNQVKIFNLVLINILKVIPSLTYLLFWLTTCKVFLNSFTLKQDSWALSDLLINYQGGFVRRGLVGQIAFFVGETFSIPINLVAIVIACVAFCFVVFIFIRENNSYPTFLLFTPIFLGSAAYGQFVVRKDFIMLAFLICSIKLLLKTTPTITTFVILNSLLVMGTLIHEAFFFLFLGAALNIWLMKINSIKALLQNFLKMPTFLPLIFLPFFASGSPSVARKINQSLIPTWELLDGKNCCAVPKATIESIGWGVETALGLPMSLLNDFSYGIWIPLGWTLSFLFALYVATSFLEKKERGAFASIFGIQLLSFLPIMIIGWDYGRWGFLIFCSTFLVFNSSNRKSEITLQGTSQHYLRNSLLTFITALPICCWSVEVYFGSTSLGNVYFNLLKPLID